ncbi:transposase [Rhodococcus sp. NPDC056960]|uniref:transposase n=1 Tax=Rhodococcus sp. NPDC056960 TaxID=3345982 RepID=UPI0036453AD0
MLTEAGQVGYALKNPDAQYVLIIVHYSVKHLPDSIVRMWLQTIVQTCVVHLLLLRNTRAYDSRNDRAEIAQRPHTGLHRPVGARRA